ncbi:hypothetical protein E4T47_01669 [Aureobasidium subglaciale]|nr:hypothetical protein E4T47_01669 [Aureobasidium subglaciale]
MSHLQYKAYAGWGETAAKSHNMSQIVRVPAGDIVKMSGQGGWNPSTGEMVTDLGGEWAKAFDNVQHALQDIGAKGWESVYKLTVYYTSENELAMKHAEENMWRCFPNHKPVVTMVMVKDLALPGMHVEVDAEAVIQ